MINTKTVFVLGAGASCEFNFPSGIQLIHRVIGNLRDPSTTQYRELREIGFSDENISTFVSSLQQAQLMSIDAFLELREEFVEIGKYAIAQGLIPFENPDSLFPTDKVTSYRYLFEHIRMPEKKISENAVFVTFNYDRSLEHFLFTVLQNAYAKNIEETVSLMNDLKLFHIHGKLGDLPWQSENSRSYSTRYTLKELTAAAKGLRIIHEGGSSEDLKRAKLQLNNASRIYFLGFGYGAVGVTRLMNSLTSASPRTVFGTSHGLAAGEKKRICQIFNAQGYRIELDKQGHQVLQYLKETVRFD